MVNTLTANRNGFNVFVFESNKEATDFTVGKWKGLAQEAFSTRRLFIVALSGGRTPRDFYRDLTGFRDADIWERTHIFMADERFVPLTDADSNYGMLSGLLLDKVPIPAENRHPIPIREETLETAAEKYEDEMRSFFGLEKARFPRFDLIMLGMGEDGHTASLFPGHDALAERTRLVYPVRKAPKGHARVTFTLPVINHARNIIFLVTGKEKAASIREVVEVKNASMPASMIRPEEGNLSFMLDREAASLLSTEFPYASKTVTQ